MKVGSLAFVNHLMLRFLVQSLRKKERQLLFLFIIKCKQGIHGNSSRIHLKHTKLGNEQIYYYWPSKKLLDALYTNTCDVGGKRGHVSGHMIHWNQSSFHL